MPNPNTQFSSGAVYTADQANRFPRGIMGSATSTTSQNLSTSSTISTGMTVTFMRKQTDYTKLRILNLKRKHHPSLTVKHSLL
jgi:hypothetical protein